MWKTINLTDKLQILAYLETDRPYAAYGIGDLEPEMFEQCEWVGAEEAGRLQALILHFRGLEPPALLLMGDSDGLRAILAEALRPEKVYLTCREEHLTTARGFYAWDEPTLMWRMALQPAHFQPVQDDCVRLTPAHADQLAALYALGEGNAFSPAQMEQGVFCGVFADGQLVAVAGTHLVSPTYGVAAVGNIFTHPDHRGHGYGTATTSRVVTALLQNGIHDVILNVSQGNVAATRIYERLGFQRYCLYLEGPADRHDDVGGCQSVQPGMIEKTE
jgi:RimJ/RimL family protein N-acetyltransferase